MLELVLFCRRFFLLSFYILMLVLTSAIDFIWAAENTMKLPEVRPKSIRTNPLVDSQASSFLQSYEYDFFKAGLRTELQSYTTPLPEQKHLNNSQLLTVQAAGKKSGTYITGQFDLTAGTFFIRNKTHLALHEAQVYNSSVHHNNAINTVALGRRKVFWSYLDENWNLGLWQPKFAIDPLRPQQQGLLGLFYELRPSEYFSLTFFASPLFVPNLGPEIRNEQGQLVADSRWYTSPSTQFTFNNRVNSVYYKLDIPEAADLAQQKSSAVRMSLGQYKQGPWLQTSYAHKPVNELLLKRQAFKSSTEDQVNVKVSPYVVNHRIFSADAGYTWLSLKNNSFRSSISYLEEQPDFMPAEKDWSVQKLLGLKIYSAALQLQTQTFSSTISYLYASGGTIQDVVSDGSPDDFTLFDERLKFKQAWSVQIKTSFLRLFKKPVLNKVQWIRDDYQRGSLWNLESSYSWAQDWGLLVGADILSVQDESYRPSSFLNQFRANDRIYGGMTYVF